MFTTSKSQVRASKSNLIIGKMASCQGVQLLYPGEEMQVFPSGPIVTLTVICGFLLGLLATVIFLKDQEKKQVQKGGRALVWRKQNRTVIHGWDGMEEEDGDGTWKETMSYIRMKEAKKKATHDEMDNLSYKDETGSTGSDDDGDDRGRPMISFTGIVSVLFKSGQSPKSRDGAMEELCIQDIRDTWTLQTETQREKTSIFVLLLRTLLGKFVTSERLSEAYMEEFVDDYQQKIEEREEQIYTELAELEKDLKKSGVGDLQIEEELEMKRPEYSRRMAVLLESLEVVMREELQRNSGLDDEEIDALYEKLHKYMTLTEKMIGQTVEEQSMILQDRLSKRQALSQQCADLSSREDKGMQTKVSEMRKVLWSSVEDRQVTEKQMESIVKDYEDSLAAADENNKREFDRQSRELMGKLQAHREAAMAKLRNKHTKEEEKLEQAAPQVVNPSDIVQAHHDLVQQHRSEHNDMVDELDYNETQALSVLRKKLSEEREEEAGDLITKMVDSLTEETELTKKEAKSLMQRYRAECDAHQELLASEKERQSEMIQKRLIERKAAWERERERHSVEQEQLARQQESTVTKVLDSQTALKDEARKRIMMQHEQNTVALKNHLQLTRMRQQKLVEAKLAKRKARIDAIKEKQLGEKAAAPGHEEAKTLKAQHDEELATELTEYSKEEKRTLEVFRSRMVIETSEMLKAQDEQMGWLLGKLQVGQARRRNIIDKQDKAIQELQEKLVDTVGDSGKVSEQKTDHIIQKHLREVEEVEDKLKQAREHQARVLQQKYETQKLIRERTILAKHEGNKAQQDSSKGRTLTTGKKSKRTALEVLSKIYEESKQEQDLKQLEQEMRSEMLKQKQDINRELEEAMRKELEEREKDFLGDLAAISELKNDEITELVTSAVEGTKATKPQTQRKLGKARKPKTRRELESGGDQSEAKQIKKDLIKRVKKARADPQESSAEPSPRKRKGKGKKKK